MRGRVAWGRRFGTGENLTVFVEDVDAHYAFPTQRAEDCRRACMRPIWGTAVWAPWILDGSIVAVLAAYAGCESGGVGSES